MAAGQSLPSFNKSSVRFIGRGALRRFRLRAQPPNFIVSLLFALVAFPRSTSLAEPFPFVAGVHLTQATPGGRSGRAIDQPPFVPASEARRSPKCGERGGRTVLMLSLTEQAKQTMDNAL
jgi:hypothetical protein